MCASLSYGLSLYEAYFSILGLVFPSTQGPLLYALLYGISASMGDGHGVLHGWSVTAQPPRSIGRLRVHTTDIRLVEPHGLWLIQAFGHQQYSSQILTTHAWTALHCKSLTWHCCPCIHVARFQCKSHVSLAWKLPNYEYEIPPKNAGIERVAHTPHHLGGAAWLHSHTPHQPSPPIRPVQPKRGGQKNRHNHTPCGG